MHNIFRCLLPDYAFVLVSDAHGQIFLLRADRGRLLGSRLLHHPPGVAHRVLLRKPLALLACLCWNVPRCVSGSIRNLQWAITIIGDLVPQSLRGVFDFLPLECADQILLVALVWPLTHVE